ncbi:hypothetical protein COLO4_25560 [Corchorus olitorius]|uniref:Reverse transcriptase zinc-binding domain-containing protein n=1 Tax=Corchorus olitorius TaxID=93759 RepID=A0A1R3I1J9_9ROSI|nr:hypothetical protein COLO4_25560 [Corchorus olitorius]
MRWQHSEGDLIAKSASLVDALKEWNRNVFGNVFERNKELRARVLGIQHALARSSCSHLLDLEKKLVSEYNQYYYGLFSVDSDMVLSKLNVGCPKLPTNQIPLLDECVSMSEVRKALFQMKPWKAPGQDGFQAGFFQRFWESTSFELWQMVYNAFEEGSLPNALTWHDVCIPKAMGGLSLRRMELHNRALLQKTAWRFISEPDSLWVRFLMAKYRINDDILKYLADKPNGSPTWSYTWRGLALALTLLSNGLKWRVGNGLNVRFWEDPWLLNDPLIFSLDSSLAVDNPGALVKEYVSTEGGWIMDKILLDLPADIALKALGMPPSLDPFLTWIDDNLLSVALISGVEWRIVFAVTLWRLWTRRCDFVMKNEEVSLEVSPLLVNIMDTVKELMLALVNSKPAAVKKFSVNWVSPEDGVVKLNVDGAAKGNPGVAGAGGLIRSSVA